MSGALEKCCIFQEVFETSDPTIVLQIEKIQKPFSNFKFKKSRPRSRKNHIIYGVIAKCGNCVRIKSTAVELQAYSFLTLL